LNCAKDEGMILSLDNQSDSESAFVALLHIQRKRNNQTLLRVLDVDKQMYIHVLSTTEAKEARGSISFLPGSWIIR
jgi:hypothetical protein